MPAKDAYAVTPDDVLAICGTVLVPVVSGRESISADRPVDRSKRSRRRNSGSPVGDDARLYGSLRGVSAVDMRTDMVGVVIELCNGRPVARLLSVDSG